MLLLGERTLLLLWREILLRPGNLAPQGQVIILRRLVLSHRVLHRLVVLVLRRSVQRRVVLLLHLAELLHHMVDALHLTDILHLAEDVVVLRRNVLHPDRLPTRLMPRLSENYNFSDSHYPRRGSL